MIIALRHILATSLCWCFSLSAQAFDYQDALLRCARAAGQPHAAEAESAEQAVYQAEIAALIEHLASSELADDQFARALMLNSNESGAAQYQALSRALELEPDHLLATAEAANWCLHDDADPFCSLDWAEHYRQLAPDNIAPLGLQLSSAVDDQDDPRIDALLEQMVTRPGPRTSVFIDSVVAVANAASSWPQSQLSEPDEAIVLGFEQAPSKGLALYQAMVSACGLANKSTSAPQRRAHCAAIAQAMAGSKTTVMEHEMGVVLLELMEQQYPGTVSPANLRTQLQRQKQVHKTLEQLALALCLIDTDIPNPIELVELWREVGEIQALEILNGRTWEQLLEHEVSRDHLESGDLTTELALARTAGLRANSTDVASVGSTEHSAEAPELSAPEQVDSDLRRTLLLPIMLLLGLIVWLMTWVRRRSP